MSANIKNIQIKVTTLAGGMYRAYCPAVKGLFAEGESAESAESALLRLIETRTEAQGAPVVGLDLAADPDSVVGRTEDDR